MTQTMIFIMFLLISQLSFARPDYAARIGTSSCNTCHYNLSGAGPRNENGKLFANNLFNTATKSQSQWWHVDVRMNLLEPRSRAANNNGFALMSAAVSATPDLTQKDGQAKSRLVLTYDMTTIGANSVRDANVQYYSEDLSENQLPKNVVTVGRMLVPFGIMTDEHRAYNRLQTKSTMNDYDMGIMLSTEVEKNIHTDIALVNGFASGGKFNAGTATKPETTSGVYGNLRWVPLNVPMTFGISAQANYSEILAIPASAVSGYTILSLDRMTSGKYLGSVSFEFVGAKGWNDTTYNGTNIGQFIPGSDLAYQAAVAQSESISFTNEWKYFLNPSLNVHFKFEEIALDKDYDADKFYRHAFGVQKFIDSNSNFIIRYEFAHSKVTGLSEQSVRGNKDSFYVIYHVWL